MSDTPDPSDLTNEALLREHIAKVLGSLSPRERQVLELRFGLTDGKDNTLAAVGRQFDLSREMVRQIEVKALRKLGRLPRIRVIKQ